MKSTRKKLNDDHMIMLRYKVVEEPYAKKGNAMCYETMKKALEDVGIRLNMSDGNLTLQIMDEDYLQRKTRGAGKKQKFVYKENGEIYRYSDVILMEQKMKDKDICEKLGMTSTTYFRHKKAMKESEYFKNLDKNRLADQEYLKSVQGDFYF